MTRKVVNVSRPKVDLVYRSILNFMVEKRYAPSMQELADNTGLGLATIQRSLAILEEMGKISRDKGKCRSITINTGGM